MRICWGLLLALLSAAALAVDLTVQWDAPNPAEPVTSIEVRWRNPTNWATVTLSPSVTSRLVQNLQPGYFSAEVRFCTTDAEYDPPCSTWVALESRVPSPPTQPVLVGDQ
jgi:hypothetical protein